MGADHLKSGTSVTSPAPRSCACDIRYRLEMNKRIRGLVTGCAASLLGTAPRACQYYAIRPGRRADGYDHLRSAELRHHQRQRRRRASTSEMADFGLFKRPQTVDAQGMSAFPSGNIRISAAPALTPS